MIVQEHDYGCGVAAVAQITKRSYQQALVLFGPGAGHKAATFGFYLHEICAALRTAGWKSYWLEVQPDTPPPTMDDIVFLPPSDQYPAGHYLAKLYIGWSNSWANFPHYPRLAAKQKIVRAPQFLIVNKRPRT